MATEISKEEFEKLLQTTNVEVTEQITHHKSGGNPFTRRVIKHNGKLAACTFTDQFGTTYHKGKQYA